MPEIDGVALLVVTVTLPLRVRASEPGCPFAAVRC